SYMKDRVGGPVRAVVEGDGRRALTGDYLRVEVRRTEDGGAGGGQGSGRDSGLGAGQRSGLVSATLQGTPDDPYIVLSR
ncbi:MAG: hypothetical protein ACOCUZ_01030, partial [bacterium]